MVHAGRLAVVAALVLVGCASETVPPEGVAREALSAGSATAQATLVEIVHDFASNAGQAGVNVCAQQVHVHGGMVDVATEDPPTCAVTGADGTVSLRVNGAKDYRVTFAADNYVSANQLLHMSGDLTTGTRLISTALGGRLAMALGTSLDLTKAQPVVTAYTPAEVPLAGLGMSLNPDSGLRWFATTSGFPSHALTATTAAGLGGFLNATPGLYEVVGTPPAGTTCNIGPYIAGSTPNSVLVEAMAGSAGEAVFHCQ
jgi:hypothetical protein